jgi:hypothetical protein
MEISFNQCKFNLQKIIKKERKKGRKNMKRICLIMAIAVLLATFVNAQKRLSDVEAFDDSIKTNISKAIEGSTKIQMNAVTTADVGEPDSFGKNVKFFGIAASGLVILTTDCSEANVGILGPDDRCQLITDQNVVTGTNYFDIGRITIPGKSLDNVLHVISRSSYSYAMNNLGTTPSLARVGFVPSLTLESVAFNDPSAIDPATGLPMNGALRTTGSGLLSITKTIAADAIENVAQNSGGSSILGFSREYFRQIGMSNSAIDRFYKNPVTIKIGIRASSQLVSEATFRYSIRLMGN